MKIAIINSKDLGLDCWSPKRLLGSCDTCDKVIRCKLPEARAGRIKLLEDKIAKAYKIVKKLEERRFQEVKEELKEESRL